MAFPQQLAVIDDPTHSKAIWCTRRAAKSFTDGLYAFHEALKYPGVNILYVGLTRAEAKFIIWKDVFSVINRACDIRAIPNLTELTWTFPNGSVIQVTGIDADEEEMNKKLGQKYRLVLVDEASLYSIDLRRFCYDIIGPATADQDGSILLSGTSSNLPRGLFYDVTTGKEPGWSLHAWTAFDNPHMAVKWQAHIDRIAKERPLYLETNQYRQWYLNEWVVDEEKLVYRFNPDRNVYSDLSPELAVNSVNGWTYILGVDLGWEDDNAFVLTGWHDLDPALYVLKTFNKPKMTFDQVAEKINEFIADPAFPIYKVVIDNANKQGVETMRDRYDIPFEGADKAGKVEFIEMINADLIQRRIKIHRECKSLQDEMCTLVWITDGDKIRVPKKENPSLSNHLCDALLYAWRNGYHFLYTPAKIKPLPGTPEYVREQDELHKESIRQRLKQEHALSQGTAPSWTKGPSGRDPWHEW
jgi:hypothetical protein